MGALVLGVLILAMAAYSDASWCVCRSDVSESALQKALDYACGAGADCAPTLQNGPCYQPNTVRGHCNYAVNSYFQKKGQAPGSCDFSGAATVTGSDPSSGSCSFPSSASGGGGSTGGVPPPSTGGTTPTPPTGISPPGTGTGTGISPPGTGTGTGISPPGTGTGTGISPPGTGTGTGIGFAPPTTGIIGGGGMPTGLGPSGTGIDSSDAKLIKNTDLLLFLAALWASGLVYWLG